MIALASVRPSVRTCIRQNCYVILIAIMHFAYSARIVRRPMGAAPAVASFLQRKLMYTGNNSPSSLMSDILMKRSNSTLVSSLAQTDTADLDPTSSTESLTFYSDGIVSVRNTQRKYRINLKGLCEDAQTIKRSLGLESFQLDILVCSDLKMRSLNRDWRGVSRSTDVLSAPLNDFTSPGVFSEQTLTQIGELHLGDIAIAPAYVKRQCRRDLADFEAGVLDDPDDAGVSLAMSTEFSMEKRLPMLLVHGILHLFGYDHETDDDWLRMTEKEDEVLQALRLSKL